MGAGGQSGRGRPVIGLSTQAAHVRLARPRPARAAPGSAPDKTYASPSRRAEVDSDAASLPLPGSVRQYDARLCMEVSCGSSCARCSAVPNLKGPRANVDDPCSGLHNGQAYGAFAGTLLHCDDVRQA